MKASNEEFPQIFNFAASDVITDAEVESYLKKYIPVQHLQGCLGIHYYNDCVIDVKTGARTYGWWDPVPESARCSMIKIFSHKNLVENHGAFCFDSVVQQGAVKKRIIKTVVHEVAHQEYHNLTIDDHGLIEEWEQLHYLSGADEFVSAYAKTSPSEDFAESYKDFVTDLGETLVKVNESKYHYFGRIFNPSVQVPLMSELKPFDSKDYSKGVINLS